MRFRSFFSGVLNILLSITFVSLFVILFVSATLKVENVSFEHFHFLYPVWGGILFWLGIKCLRYRIIQDNRYQVKVRLLTPVYEFITSILNLVLIFGGLVLALADYYQPLFVMLFKVEYPPVFLKYILIINGISLVCVLVYVFTITSQNIVPQNSIRVVNGKIFHSGQRYWKFPFVYYTENVIQKEIRLYNDVEIECSDITFKAQLSFPIRIILDKVDQSNIKSLSDDSTFDDDVYAWAFKLIKESASNMTIGQFLKVKGIIPDRRIAVLKIFIYWSGEFTVTNIRV
ncbi:hypothetical protein ACFL1Y_01185 [Patescibacteria group bacterium]